MSTTPTRVSTSMVWGLGGLLAVVALAACAPRATVRPRVAAPPRVAASPHPIVQSQSSRPPGHVSVAAGGFHTCALLPASRLSDSVVKCWGANSHGQLGTGSTQDTTTPAIVAGIISAVAVATGGFHTCALLPASRLSDSVVKCWGANSHGQLGNGTITDSPVAVPVAGITNATAVSAGAYHTCAGLANGTVKCWGYNFSGQLGNGTAQDAAIPVAVAGITSATVLTAGEQHTCARLSDGTVHCWGANDDGQLGTGTMTGFAATPAPVTGMSTATTVAAGGRHACAGLANGTVKCWGRNTLGQLGTGTTTTYLIPTMVYGVTTAIAVMAGANHTCALLSASRLSDSVVKCWGANTSGQLGSGRVTSSTMPISITGLDAVALLTTGWDHTCAQLQIGPILCWGDNTRGQLGTGSTANALSPTLVTGW